MTLTVNIASNDRTGDILWKTFGITDNINEKANICSFEARKYGDKTWKPVLGDTVQVIDGTSTPFSGTVVRVKEVMEGTKLQKFQVKAIDHGRELDRQQVSEHYSGMTVDDIIADIITNYTSGFTGNAVNCSIEIASITFNYLTVSQCLSKLTRATNFVWYVDYDKDIHFFEKNSEPTSFGITDTNGKHLNKSLVLTDDLSQLRNRVRIRGGELEGDPRTEYIDGDDTKQIFVLANKFSAKPAVIVHGVATPVGLDFLSNEDDFQCFWNFNEKYIRFKGITGAGANAIAVTATPLIPIIAQVDDDVSINTYGIYEFYKKDTSIKTKDEAKQFASAELSAYADSIVEGQFRTYESGLRSGQIIAIQSDIRSIDESFLIQSVRLRMRGYNEGVWDVKLATLRTIGIIEVLQKLLLAGQIEVKESEDEVVYKFYTDHQDISIAELITAVTAETDEQSIGITESIRKDPWTPQWVLGPYFPRALEFNGTSQYVEIADHDDFSFGNGSNDSPFSISARINMDSATSFVIASKWIADTQQEWDFWFSQSKIFFNIFELDNWRVWQGRKYNTALSTGQWYHVVATYDGSGGATAHDGMKIYIDGVRKDDTDNNGLDPYTAMSDGTAPVWIGRRGTTEADGKIDEVRIYNRELGATEIAEMADGIHNNESGLVLKLPIIRSTGEIVEDVSGKGHHGTLKPTYPGDVPIRVASDADPRRPFRLGISSYLY